MKTYSIVAQRIPTNRLTVDCRKPQNLYRYSSAQWLERSLKLGEFRLRPATDYRDLSTDLARNDDELVRLQSTDGKHVKITLVGTGQDITPTGVVTYRSEVHRNYLVSCFSSLWDHRLFNEFPDTDACLVIHKVEEFCERFHAAVEVQLSGWTGFDGAVVYGGRSPLGPVFSKPLRFLQHRTQLLRRLGVGHLQRVVGVSSWERSSLPAEVLRLLRRQVSESTRSSNVGGDLLRPAKSRSNAPENEVNDSAGALVPKGNQLPTPLDTVR